MLASARSRALALAGRAFDPNQLRDPRTGKWIDTGLVKRITEDIGKAVEGATTRVDWRGIHVTAPVRGQPVTVTVSPLDIASLALLVVPGAGEVGVAVEAARAAMVVRRIRQALAVAKAAETVAGAVKRSAEERHRMLVLAGVDVRGYDPAKHPHAPAGPNGGQFISTHGLVSALKEILTDAEASHDYGDELDRVDFTDDACVVARSEGALTIQSGYSDGRSQIHAAPTPGEAQDWASTVDSMVDQAVAPGSTGAAGPNGLVDFDVDGTMLVGYNPQGQIIVRWVNDDTSGDDLENLDGFDLSPDEARTFAGALRDMAYVTEDHATVPDGADVVEPAGDETPIPDAKATRDRQLRLLGVETRRYNPAQKRVSKGNTTGGQFLSLSSRVLSDLTTWLNAGGTGPDPLAAYSQPQLKSAATQLGLNPPKGMKLVPLKSLLETYVKTRQAGHPGVPALGGPPSGSISVSRAVAGVPGVTALKIPPQAVAGPSWMSPSESLRLHLNGADLGVIHKHSYGWTADTPSGNPLGVGSGATKTAAVRALVAHHQATNLTHTNVPGVTLTPWQQPFSNAAGAMSADVHLNGVDVGNIHSNNGTDWTAFPPTGSTWGLQANPGSGQTYPDKDAAIQALVTAHNTQPVPSSGQGIAHALPNGVTANRWATPFSGFDTTYSLYYGGVHIGAIHEHQATGAWIVYTTGPKKQLNPEYNEHDAAEAVLDEYKANPWSSPTKLAPVATRIQEAINRHVAEGGGPNDRNDPLSGFTHRQLADVARKNNIPSGATVTRRQLSASLIQALAPKVASPSAVRAAASPAVKAAQDVLYGVDPKANTAARQLEVYGALRKAEFEAMDITEQTHMLADLSFIATTSKGTNATKAQKLIDRFTPAGTQLGTLPVQPSQVVGPASGTQTRLPSPQPGLIRQAVNSGSRGDAWVSGTSGPAVWGEYGSGGLLLRHVDGQGVERFLMTQRGPGVSDPGVWSYPGGAFESKEDFYQGATREVAEELGWTDADFTGALVHGYHVFERPDVKAKDGSGGTRPWTYHSVAVEVPTRIVPQLKAAGARAETSDAKWLTRAEIEQLDRQGKLHSPVAGGKLQANVMSLFPAPRPTAARPGPVTTRQPRLTGTPVPPLQTSAHKPSRGTNLVADRAAEDALRAQVSAVRKNYRGKTADERLAAIGAMQGYDDTPTVAPKSEVDRLLATGAYIEAWRGVTASGSKTAARINEELRSGPAYYGTGVYGNGYYFATDRSVARGYADGTKNSVVRVLIPRSAKTDLHANIKRKAAAASSSSSSANVGRSGDLGGGTLRDEGRYAAAMGLDGIEIPHTTASHIASSGQPSYAWVNRSVLVIQEADP